MPEPDQGHAHLLRATLQPLLEDFEFWFARGRSLLESCEVPFLTDDEQADLIARLCEAQKELTSCKLLVEATGGQVAVDLPLINAWHDLVTDYWKVAMRLHAEYPNHGIGQKYDRE